MYPSRYHSPKGKIPVEKTFPQYPDSQILQRNDLSQDASYTSNGSDGSRRHKEDFGMGEIRKPPRNPDLPALYRKTPKTPTENQDIPDVQDIAERLGVELRVGDSTTNPCVDNEWTNQTLPKVLEREQPSSAGPDIVPTTPCKQV